MKKKLLTPYRGTAVATLRVSAAWRMQPAFALSFAAPCATANTEDDPRPTRLAENSCDSFVTRPEQGNIGANQFLTRACSAQFLALRIE